jgi:hypothetical protein
MSDPIALTTTQRFEIERFNRVIDATSNVEELRTIAKQLLEAWQGQKAAAAWVLRQPRMNR